VLSAGGLVAFPTETFYGLGARALDAAAVRQVFDVKGRPEAMPLLVLVDSIRMLEDMVEEVPAVARGLIARHWPGPLTLVFRARARVPVEVTAGTGTIGVRRPGLPLAEEIVRALGEPVTAPSANPTGEAPPRNAAAVLAAFDDRIDLVLDGGDTAGGPPSTVLDVTVDPPRVVRRGAVPV
jgi:L-threonylcarbamoyladenylate synthase